MNNPRCQNIQHIDRNETGKFDGFKWRFQRKRPLNVSYAEMFPPPKNDAAKHNPSLSYIYTYKCVVDPAACVLGLSECKVSPLGSMVCNPQPIRMDRQGVCPIHFSDFLPCSHECRSLSSHTPCLSRPRSLTYCKVQSAFILKDIPVVLTLVLIAITM